MSIAAIVIIVAAVAVVGAAAWYVALQRRHTDDLRTRYGSEYSRTVSELGSQRRAEHELERRQERVAALDIHPLAVEQRTRFAQEWRNVQSLFVDDPGGAITRADGLVEEVMKVRGYPVSDFDQRAADLSVHHAHVIENYRAAREIAMRHRRGAASTEELRRAMMHYRELFEDLLEDREHPMERAVERPIERELPPATRRVAEAPVDGAPITRTDRDLRP
ncbi:MAG TPA: hypothetical protein VGP95_08010 [Gemmatimonadaceae bacterium]|jgi:hypothetical protein|nr:hypothetical protein [Gemmatimonadaceae bacterium]